MEKEMQIAQDQISARREEQERSVQSVKRLDSLMVICLVVFCYFDSILFMQLLLGVKHMLLVCCRTPIITPGRRDPSGDSPAATPRSGRFGL